MVTVTVAVLTIFFAIGTLSPLLITDETEEVIDLEPPRMGDQGEALPATSPGVVPYPTRPNR